MERDTITNYLKRAEFSAVQADALADILTEHASRSEMRELRADFRHLEQKLDDRFDALEATMTERFRAFESKTSDRSTTLMETIELKFDGMEDRMSKSLSQMEARLTWRLLALMTFMGTVMTLVGTFLD